MIATTLSSALSGMFDYNIQGVAGYSCRWCGHPDDDRRLSSIEEMLVQTAEFEQFEKTFCDAIVNKGQFAGASVS